MGGYGSGRYGGRPTSEACASLVLSTTTFLRAGLRAAMKATASITFTAGGERFPVAMVIDTTDKQFPFIEFDHESRSRSSPSPQRYRVRLQRSPQPFGGMRWWFECPRTGARCVKLYLPRPLCNECGRRIKGSTSRQDDREPQGS